MISVLCHITPCSSLDYNSISQKHAASIFVYRPEEGWYTTFKMLVPTSQTTWHHIPADPNLHRRENINSRWFSSPSMIPILFQRHHHSQCRVVAVDSTKVRTPCDEVLIIPGSLTWPRNCCVWSSNVGACAVKAMTTATLSYVLSLRHRS